MSADVNVFCFAVDVAANDGSWDPNAKTPQGTFFKNPFLCAFWVDKKPPANYLIVCSGKERVQSERLCSISQRLGTGR